MSALLSVRCKTKQMGLPGYWTNTLSKNQQMSAHFFLFHHRFAGYRWSASAANAQTYFIIFFLSRRLFGARVSDYIANALPKTTSESCAKKSNILWFAANAWNYIKRPPYRFWIEMELILRVLPESKFKINRYVRFLALNKVETKNAER